MKKFLFILATAVFLTACGGGTGSISAGASPGTPTQNPSNVSVASVTVQSSASAIAVDGSTTATITALVRDANNTFVPGVTVAFAASGGGLAVTQATTDASGAATATLSASGVAAGTQITITAAAAGVSGNVVAINVVNIQRTITLTTSSPQIPSDGSAPATITAYVKDANNQFVPNVSVTFQATSGAVNVTQGATDPKTGAATATLNVLPSDPSNRRITITASAGSASGTIDVDVVGTKLALSGPTTLISGAQGTYTATLTDSAGKGISGQTVALVSTNSNSVIPASASTDSTGHASFTITAATAGADSLRATSLGLNAIQALSVSNQNFSFTSPAANTKINIGQVATITVRWLSGATPQSGQTVTFSSTRGTLSATSAVTNGSGLATVTITSASAGPAIVSASAAGVSAQLGISFVATTPNSINVQASPSTIPTQGQSTISAVVRDATNNLVEGQTVAFTLTDVTGGSLSAATAVTDAQGKAQITYTGSATPSATNGVTINASVQASSVTGSTTLTVGGQTVFLSLGTGNKIAEDDPALPTRFVVPFSVLAVDAAGNAVNGVPITLTIHSLQYAKGGWIIIFGGCGTSDCWVQTGTPAAAPPTNVTVCASEDVNGNGVLDAGEDFNGSGTLEPRDVAATSSGTITTANNGTANFTVTYPENDALWVQVRLTATATVQGTQSSTSSVFWLPILAKYVLDTTSDPPGNPSPFGVATDCADSR